ncbi:MAG: ribonuclease H-like domain-containing protein [Pseudoalteromonas sp.]|uniref:ribonuclease H-like domain-containing protein n=1 Tax=Pseudoalteromonas sp. TaxID=53249 RepID=UPI001D3C309A|nr:ribonuclease H-like domain-containing protein [Pseudoalteromonas sp.]NRA77283.1 ribonuclease H-like domain-containing protein [Pseudoalteromonas sp.]
MRELIDLNQGNLLFFDIETAPIVKELEPDTPLYDSWEYKVNKDGDLEESDIIKLYSKEASLYPEFAKIVCIVLGKIVKGEIVLITYDHEDEVELLKQFAKKLDTLPKDTLVGFANKIFDTPFICKRMILNGIEPDGRIDSSGLKPWEVSEIDLAEVWKLTSITRASLINVATAFGLSSPKDDISGADVGRVYWNEPNGLKRISEYCSKDVSTTINIFRGMCMRNFLNVGKNVIVDTSSKLKSEAVMQHLFSGGRYTKKHKESLLKLLKTLPSDELDIAFTILNSCVSTAKGRKTKITKTHVKELKEELV